MLVVDAHHAHMFRMGNLFLDCVQSYLVDHSGTLNELTAGCESAEEAVQRVIDHVLDELWDKVRKSVAKNVYKS